MFSRQLEYLVALDRERHFGRAAASCHVSQPALSEAIRSLERELGVPLVRRGRRFEGLTPEGERVLTWAQRAVANLRGLEQEVSRLREGLVGTLRLGAIPTSLPTSSLSDHAVPRAPPADARDAALDDVARDRARASRTASSTPA